MAEGIFPSVLRLSCGAAQRWRCDWTPPVWKWNSLLLRRANMLSQHHLDGRRMKQTAVCFTLYREPNQQSHHRYLRKDGLQGQWRQGGILKTFFLCLYMMAVTALILATCCNSFLPFPNSQKRPTCYSLFDRRVLTEKLKHSSWKRFHKLALCCISVVFY